MRNGPLENRSYETTIEQEDKLAIVDERRMRLKALFDPAEHLREMYKHFVHKYYIIIQNLSIKTFHLLPWAINTSSINDTQNFI